MSPRFSIIPAGAITDQSLEPRDLQILCLLGRHTNEQGWCKRSQVKMAAELSCGRATVQRSLERLVDAGWVQKKQRGVPDGAEPGHPSASYAYRVILDRDDFAFEAAARENAEPESDGMEGVPIDEHPPGAQPDGHPGAHPGRARGAHTYVGTKNDPLERSPLERERDARARDRKARFLAAFEHRWPTSAADDRQRVSYAAEELSETDERAALDGIGPFLEDLKRNKRGHVPAGWKYLEQRRWTLLPQAKQGEGQGGGYHADGSEPAKALAVLHAIAGKLPFFHGVMKRPGAGVFYSRAIEPRLLALATAPGQAEWVTLNRQQAAAWEDLLRAYVTVQTRHRLVEGARAPWPWPPRKDGTLSDTGADPPTVPELTDDDLAALAEERAR